MRRRLTIWLLGGLFVLWLIAGVGTWIAVRQSLIKSIDATLAVDSRIIRFSARGEPGETPARFGAAMLRDRLPEYNSEDGNAYFQIQRSDGEIVERSTSLGDQQLIYPGRAENAPAFRTITTTDGKKLRAMKFRSPAGGKGKGKAKGRRSYSAAVIARDMTPVNEALTALTGGIIVVGAVLAGVAVLLIRIALNDGLRPLGTLAKQTGEITPGTLDVRFDSTNTPEELLPIYNKLNLLLERLEQGFERERRFSSDLAHEMRTPVAELKALNEVALKWPDQSGEKTHGESLAIAERLHSIIQNLLSLSRWESGQETPEMEEVNVVPLLRESWNSDVVVEFQFSSDELNYTINREMLLHIIENLYNNAAEYTPAGSTVKVTADSDFISVSNPAPDLTEEDLPLLFERYWRADQARANSRHTGLGLSLAKACAKATGFSLEAEMQDGVVTFLIRKE